MPRVSVIQIGVTDMQKALDFYCGVLGFEVESKDDAPRFVTLRNEPTLLLALADAPARAAYPREAQVLLNLETRDLRADLARLRDAGVELLHDAPQPCPVGTFAAFRDPSGNVGELLELGGRA